MRYALINNGLVVNVIEADEDFIAGLQGYDAAHPSEEAGTGWAWNGSGFVPPAQEEEAPPAADLGTRITRLAFRNRFTAAEKVALELASLDDPAATMAARQQAAAVRVYLQDVAASTFIDLASDKTVSGVQALEAGGLLAPGRAAEIIGAPVTSDEQYTA